MKKETLFRRQPNSNGRRRPPIRYQQPAQQQANLLPKFVGGEETGATVAVLEPQPLFDPAALRTTAKKGSGGYLLNGEKSMVALAQSAKWFLVAAELPRVG